MQTLEFKEGYVDKIEKQIISHIQQYGEEEPLLLNMIPIPFIQVDALVYLISFIARRESKNQKTKIQYYRNNLIRSFIHNSRFFEVIKDVTGLDIHDLATDLPDYFDSSTHAVDYFNKPKYQCTENGSQKKLTEEEKIEYLREKGFYPLVSLPFASETEKSVVLKEEPKNWTEGKSLVSIIQKNLPDKAIIGDKISKHIIYESITNSIRHPSSNKLVISCICQQNYYTLVIWDNGESIIETLMSELEKGHTIKTEKELIDDPHSCYCIIKEKKIGRLTAENIAYYFSSEVPTLKNSAAGKEYLKEKWFILLASFFPGVTRDPNGYDYKKSKALGTAQKPALTGRGLTYLINAAVRNFGGEVRVRTSNYSMHIKKAEKNYKTLPDLFFKKFKDEYYVIDMKDKYDEAKIQPKNKKIINSLFNAKIHECPQTEATFFGNMITVKIPQKA